MEKQLTVGINDAKAHFSKLVKQAQAGQEIVLQNRGKPVAKIVAYEAPPPKRTLGSLAGKMWIAPDFDELPDVLAEFFE